MRRFGALAVLAILCCSAVALAAGGGGEPHVNWWARDMHAPPVGWYLLDFILFLGLIVYFAKGPIGTSLAQRHATIRRGIAENVEALQSARDKQQDARGKLDGVDAQAKELLTSAEEQAASERQRIVDDAAAYAARMRKDSEALVDQEVTMAFSRLRTEVAAEALTKAEVLLGKAMTADDQQRLLDEAIAGLEHTGQPADGAAKVTSSKPEVRGTP